MVIPPTAAAELPATEIRRRDLCTDCNRSRESCFCKYTKPFATNTRFLILMHPREFKRQRTGTGRVTRKSLVNSEIFVGVDFTRDERLNRYLSDSSCFPVLLFPGEKAIPANSAEIGSAAKGRQLIIIILDATWASARKMLNCSSNLQKLPRTSFELSGASRFVIKRQPQELCLSTIEAVYRLLDIFDQNGIEDLAGRHTALMETLDAIVQFQLRCAADPALPSHRINGKRTIVM